MLKLTPFLVFLLLNCSGIYQGVTGDEDMGAGEEETTHAMDEGVEDSGGSPQHSTTPIPEVEPELDMSSANEALAKINMLRAMHGSPNVTIDKTLAASAQKHAQKIASTGVMSISCTKSGCPGENLAMGPPNKKIAVEIKNCIQRWYNTNAQYDYSTGKAKNKTLPGSFTQLLWRNSKKVGIGAAEHPKTKYIYVVVQFLPAGNVAGAYKFNIKPPLAGAVTGDVPAGDADGGSKKTTSKPNPKGEAPPAEDIPSGDAAPGAAPTKKPTKPTPKGKAPVVGDVPAGSEDAEPKAPTKKAGSKDEKSAKPVSGNGEDKAYQNQVLEFINKLRKKHHAPPLTLDESLTILAQDQADKNAKTGKLGSACKGDECNYGTNLASAKPNANMAEGVKDGVQLWYDEEPNYDYTTGKEKKGKKFPGAFTALVWKESTSVGIGATVKGPNGNIFVVVTFQPQGNIAGQFTDNVQKA